MNRKVKFMIAALLGFSAACSSVKNSPVKGADENTARVDTTQVNDTLRRRIIVMYGVRPPRTNQIREGQMDRLDQVDPVSERPVDSLDIEVIKTDPAAAKKSGR